jgi:hypothetical protein
MNCKYLHAGANFEISRNDPISGKEIRVLGSEFCILHSVLLDFFLSLDIYFVWSRRGAPLI